MGGGQDFIGFISPRRSLFEFLPAEIDSLDAAHVGDALDFRLEMAELDEWILARHQKMRTACFSTSSSMD